MWLRISIASVFVWKGILKWINVGCRFHITAWTLIPSPPLSESSSSSEKKPQPDTKHRLLTVLLDALLNRVSVKHCSCGESAALTKPGLTVDSRWSCTYWKYMYAHGTAMHFEWKPPSKGLRQRMTALQNTVAQLEKEAGYLAFCCF